MHATSVQSQDIGDIDGHAALLARFSGLASFPDGAVDTTYFIAANVAPTFRKGPRFNGTRVGGGMHPTTLVVVHRHRGLAISDVAAWIFGHNDADAGSRSERAMTSLPLPTPTLATSANQTRP